jgi:hypothetical protein
MGRRSHLDSDAMDTIPEPKIIRSHPSDDCLKFSHALNEDTNDSSQTFVNNFNINISNDQFYASISKADNNSSINLFIDIQHMISALTLRSIYYPTCVRDHNHFYRPLFKRSEASEVQLNDTISLSVRRFLICEPVFSRLKKIFNQTKKKLMKNAIQIDGKLFGGNASAK